MSMDRRDFIKHLALLAAGAAALPEQVLAFERHYTLNAMGATGLAAVDRFMICGLATSQRAVEFNIMLGNSTYSRPCMSMGINLFGGVLSWAALPDEKLVGPAEDIGWSISAPGCEDNESWLKGTFKGFISYIDQSGFRRNRELDACMGTLV
jgi:hypothetical protein